MDKYDLKIQFIQNFLQKSASFSGNVGDVWFKYFEGDYVPTGSNYYAVWSMVNSDFDTLINGFSLEKFMIDINIYSSSRGLSASAVQNFITKFKEARNGEIQTLQGININEGARFQVGSYQVQDLDFDFEQDLNRVLLTIDLYVQIVALKQNLNNL